MSDRMFREYEKLQPALDHILQHIIEEIPLKDLCAILQCGENSLLRKFKKYYGLSPERFITMLRMREAARELLSDKAATPLKLTNKYGFSHISAFSKAFRRIIGMSPRKFKECASGVPDMPLPRTFNGHKLFFKYLKTDGFDVYGYELPLERGIETDILKECAYPLEHGSQRLDMDGEKDQIGFWWSESRDELYYVLGYKSYSSHDIPEDARVFHFGGSGYAVFSLERKGSLQETLLAHRMMVYYAMMIWQKINHKAGNTMAYTYESFGRNYTHLYLPLWKGMPEDEETVSKGTGLDEWIAYIDQHINEDMSPDEIAARFNYSERHFYRIFKNYFEYSVQEYIRKRRLYLAARDIDRIIGREAKEEILLPYGFKTLERFRQEFEKEFHLEPESYLKVSFHVPNLSRYYLDHKDQVRVTVRDTGQTLMAGKKLQERDLSEERDEALDIPDLTAYWMTHDQDEVKGTRFECVRQGEENKAALWHSDTETGISEYILGPVVESFAELPAGFMPVTVPAGKYAVIETLSEADDRKMAHTYRMLSRCAYGWIREYRDRVNLDQVTFVRYRGRKLYFYIPIYE